MAERATPPIRGRRGRDRRLAEEAASTLAARHRPIARRGRGRLRPGRGRRRGRGRPSRRGPRRCPGATPGAETTGGGRATVPEPAPAARPGLTPAAAGGHGVVRLVARAPRQPGRRPPPGRPARRARRGAPRREVVPRGGARARGHGRAARLDRARRGDRRPGRRGAGRLAGRPGGGRRPRAADRAGLRAERARRRRDGRPRRGPRRVAQRPGARPRRRRPGAAPAHAGRRRPAGRAAAAPARPAAPPGRAAARPLRARLRAGPEVAGRGEFAKRGGIVDVFPPSLPLPIRIEFFGDEIDSLRAFDPTDQRTVRPVDDAVLLPASEFLLPAGGAAAIRDRLGRAAATLPERLAADLTRFEGAEDDRLGTSGGTAAKPTGETRAMVVGDAAEVWAAHLAPATGLDHLGPGTLLVLDEPGDIAEAAEFLWRQADERRAELIGAGELPKDWPSTYLPAQDWKARLTGSRTLELTWESDPAVGTAMARGALSSGDLFGWREPTLPFGRAAGVVDAVAGWRADGARVVLASDQAARLADLLEEAGQSVAVVERIAEPPPPGAVTLVDRSLNGGFTGGPDGLTLVTDRELFGTVRVRRPRALRRVVPARHPRAADARRPRRPHRPRRRALRADDAAIVGHRRRARLPRALVRGGRPDLRARSSRSTASPATSAAERPPLSQARRQRVAARQAARPQGRRRTSPRSCWRCTPRGPSAQGHAFAPDTPWQAEMEASFPYEETADQLRAVARGQGRHGADPPDGPPRRRRRRLRQDRGGAARRVQGDRRTARRSRCSCRRRSSPRSTTRRSASASPRSRSRSAAVALRARDGAGARRVEGLAAGTVDIVIGTHRLLQQGRPVQGPGPGRRRRGAALRRGRTRSGSSSCAPRSTC